jgi:hypothetical protein
MLPTDFKYRNLVLGKPENMTDEECMELPVYKDKIQYISCWKLNKEEMDLIAQTGTVYLRIFSSIHPPVMLDIESPFKEE